MAALHGDCRLKAHESKAGEVQQLVQTLPPDLASSYNIGLADFYPATSGKQNAASYIVDKLQSDLQSSFLLCDDDNDMGEASCQLHCSARLFGCSARLHPCSAHGNTFSWLERNARHDHSCICLIDTDQKLLQRHVQTFFDTHCGAVKAKL